MLRLIVVALALTCAVIGGAAAGHGAWIGVKAQAAQYLIERAWQRSERREARDSNLQPWPWADTQVLARLRVPSAAQEQFVLAGAHGQALAFGPGHLSGTPLPGEFGNSVIAGHRDTHFEFLRDIGVGDEIFFDLPDGRTVRYRVRRVWVTTEDDLRPLAEQAATALTLITCYPFDALRAGGPLRYIVEAQA